MDLEINFDKSNHYAGLEKSSEIYPSQLQGFSFCLKQNDVIEIDSISFNKPTT
jgi:hypothetical protein